MSFINVYNLYWAVCAFWRQCVGDKLQYLLQFPPLPLQLCNMQHCGVCLHGVCIAGMYLRISKALVSQSFIESSSWLRVFLKKKKNKCLFCLLDLLFLVSEYCASRKKSLNCWSRAFFQSLPRIKWLNKKAHRFYFLREKNKKE